MVLLFYTTYISVDLAHHKIFRAKVGKGGINGYTVVAKFRMVSQGEYSVW